MTSEMGKAVMVSYVVYARVLKVKFVTQWTDNSTLLSHGAYHIQETDIITGQDFMVDWNGMVSSVQQLLTLNLWENRLELFLSPMNITFMTKLDFRILGLKKSAPKS